MLTSVAPYPIAGGRIHRAWIKQQTQTWCRICMRRSSCSTHLRECHWSTPRAGSRCLLRGPLALGSDTQVSPVTMSLMDPYGSLWGDAAPPKSEALAKGDKDISWASAPTAKIQQSTLLLYSNKQRCWETRKCHQLGTKTIWLKVLSTEILTNVCVWVCVLCLQQSIYCRFLFQHQE